MDVDRLIKINRDASTRVLHFNFLFQPKATIPCCYTTALVKSNLYWILIRPQHPEPNLKKEGSRSLSSLRSRDRPRACLRGHRWRRSSTLVTFVVRPKLSPTVAAATLEVLRACYCKVCESRCCCQGHRTIVGLGNRTRSMGFRHRVFSTPPMHALLGLVDLYLTICWGTWT